MNPDLVLTMNAIEKIFHRLSRILSVTVFCVSSLFGRCAFAATPCLNNADDVTLRGTAATEHLKASDGRDLVVWILTTENPVCINTFIDGGSLQKSQTYVGRIQILGVAPPAGVPIELKGILRTGNTASSYAVPNALTVVSGTRLPKGPTEAATVIVPTEPPRRDEPETKVKKAVTSRSQKVETKTPVMSKAITDALQKAKQMALLFKVDSLEIELDDTPGASGYSIYLHYSANAFNDQWTAQQSVIVFDNNYNLAREFVKQLINIDQDPYSKTNPKYVDVCSEMDEQDPLSKKPAYQLLGCARYMPEKDFLDPDFAKIPEKLTTQQ